MTRDEDDKLAATDYNGSQNRGLLAKRLNAWAKERDIE